MFDSCFHIFIVCELDMQSRYILSSSTPKVKTITNPTITDSVSILAGPATLSLVLVLVLLLVLSGDIELNPGPG